MNKTKHLSQKPDVYSYLDVHQFLNDTIAHLKKSERQFSLRKLAQKSGISSGLLPALLARQYSISKKTLNKISQHLDLSRPERAFLEWLRQLSESHTQQERLQAYKNICRHRRYKQTNENDIEAHQYLNKWYFPVIRELVKCTDFQLDPHWIRKQLQNKITLSEAGEAIQYLVKKELIVFNENGKPVLKNKQITCSGGVYKLAMSQYHQQVLDLAIDSIYETQSENRDLNIHTFACPKDQFPKIKKILADTLEKIRSLQVEGNSKNAVYQACLLSFPVAEVKSRTK